VPPLGASLVEFHRVSLVVTPVTVLAAVTVLSVVAPHEAAP